MHGGLLRSPGVGYLPRRSKGGRLQEKRRHEQVGGVLCYVFAQELSPEPALGQATRGPETRVLLLESATEMENTSEGMGHRVNIGTGKGQE